MLCRPKKSELRRRIQRYGCAVLAMILLLSAYLEFAVKSQLCDVITAEAEALAQTAVNNAVIDCLAEQPDIADRLMQIQCDKSGAVTALNADPAAVNTLKASVSNRAQAYIDQLSADQGVTIPLGSFSGLVFLNSIGPGIRMEIACQSTVVCSMKSTFESAGFNQTLHRVTLTAEVDIVVWNPFKISVKKTVNRGNQIKPKA